MGARIYTGTPCVLFLLGLCLSLLTFGCTSPAAQEKGLSAPSLVVQGYLEALARGDATAALGYGDSGSTVAPYVTTDEMLQVSLATHPITDIKVDNCDPGEGDGCDVGVHYKFVGKNVDYTISVRRSGAGQPWKLWWPTQDVDIDAGYSIQDYQINGVPFQSTSAFLHFALLPGYYQITSGNPLLTVTNAEIVVAGLGSDQVTETNPVTGVSAEGETKVKTAVKAKIVACMKQWKSLKQSRMPSRTCEFSFARAGSGKPKDFSIGAVGVPQGPLYAMDLDGHLTVTNASNSTTRIDGDYSQCVPIDLVLSTKTGTVYACYFWADISDPDNIVVRVM